MATTPVETTLADRGPARGSRIMAQGVLGWIGSATRAIVNRHDMRRLLELDDRSLKDIGLVRSDVLGALAEPLIRDPSGILVTRSVERRARAGRRFG